MLKTTLVFAVIFRALAPNAGAQVLTTIHTFTSYGPGASTNADGSQPDGDLVLSGSTLYGTASSGGANARGVIFSMITNGSNFTVLHTFAPTSFFGTNIDGALPAGLVLFGNTLYGTAPHGGTNGVGTVFSVSTSGSNFTVLHTFAPYAADPSTDDLTNADGAHPSGTVCLAGGVLYGTAENDGTNGWGTVFALNTNGSNFTVLHTFSNNGANDNEDGANPAAGLALINDTLYGIASTGGSNGTGTIFAIKTNGDNFAVLHTFATTSGLAGLTNADGADPAATMIASGNTLYGTTSRSGLAGDGTVFALDINDTNFTVVSDFGTNNGYASFARLVLSGRTLFGTASGGGAGTNGTVFSVSTNGSNFTLLHAFAMSVAATNSDGETPMAGMVLSGNTLYGTTELGGTNGNGTVFALTLPAPPVPIPLSIELAGTNAVLTWTNPAFSLYASPNVTGAYMKVDSAVSPFTNPITSPQQFFRLELQP